MRKSYELEALDTGNYSDEEYQACLKKLGQIGAYLGGDRAGLRAFKELSPNPCTILDVGCGGGYFAALLAKHYPEAHVLGIDLNAQAISFASRTHCLPNLRFEVQKEKSLKGLSPVDVVTATLVCHHMKGRELVVFLQEARKLAKERVILNDLHRSRMAYFLFALITPLFRSRLITEDGLLSIRRAFTCKEWRAYLARAGIADYRIVWRPGFRWVVSF